MSKIFSYISTIFILSFLQPCCASKKQSASYNNKNTRNNELTVKHYVATKKVFNKIQDSNNGNIYTENINDDVTLDINSNAINKSFKKKTLEIKKDNEYDANYIGDVKIQMIARHISHCGGDTRCINSIRKNSNTRYL